MTMTRELQRDRLTVLADEFKEERRAADRYWELAIAHAIKAGEKLIEAKSLCRHGEWLPWLRDNANVGQREAQIYMRLARNPDLITGLRTIPEAVDRLATLARMERKLPDLLRTFADFFERDDWAEILDLTQDEADELILTIAFMLEEITHMIARFAGKTPQDVHQLFMQGRQLVDK